jgi:hypothetical protein
MLGGSVGSALLNSIFAAAVTAYLTAHLAAARLTGHQALTGQALVHAYTTAFWWSAGIFAAGAVICGALLRPGPLAQPSTPFPERGAAQAQAEAEASQRIDMGEPAWAAAGRGSNRRGCTDHANGSQVRPVRRSRRVAGR